MPKTVTLLDADGQPREVAEGEVQYHLDRGWSPESVEQKNARLSEEVQKDIYESPGAKVVTFGAGVLSGVSGGLSDVGIAALGGSEQLRKLKERNPGTSTVGTVAGSVLPVGAGGLAARAGTLAAGTIKGGSKLAQLARAGVAGATEGAIMGAGQGISELAVSDDPLTLERVAAVIGSNTLFGAGTGGLIGAGSKGVELGLRRAKNALDNYAAKGSDVATDVGDDLAGLDAKGLRTAKAIEVDAINEARVPLRAQAADELAKFRADMKQNKVWLATKGADDAEIRAIGKRTLKADRQLDNLLDDPKALAENPKAALSQLRKQEAALDDLVTKHGEKLRAQFASDTSGTRMAALDYAPKALEQNRALQAKIAELSGKPASARLDAIDDAMAGLGGAKAKPGSTVGDMLGQGALGYAVGSMAGVPFLGEAVLATRAIGSVMKRLDLDGAAAAARGSRAIDVFLDASAKVAPAARMTATKVLSSVAYGPSGAVRENKKQKRPADLAKSYTARAKELRSLTAPGPDGKPLMRADKRAAMATRLAGVAAVNPRLADRIESTKARGIEYLASMLPRRPDITGVQIGPDMWQPDDMAMRGFARRVAAVEDPYSVIERLADGSVTPEDVETMKAVYPEIYADITTQIVMRLGDLRAQLPYQRRLALSIFSGVPVDPAMDPRVLNALQAQFALEEGSEGGTQPPLAQPQFGSVSKEKPTPAQEQSL